MVAINGTVKLREQQAADLGAHRPQPSEKTDVDARRVTRELLPPIAVPRTPSEIIRYVPCLVHCHDEEASRVPSTPRDVAGGLGVRDTSDADQQTAVQRDTGQRGAIATRQ